MCRTPYWQAVVDGGGEDISYSIGFVRHTGAAANLTFRAENHQKAEARFAAVIMSEHPLSAHLICTKISLAEGHSTTVVASHLETTDAGD